MRWVSHAGCTREDAFALWTAIKPESGFMKQYLMDFVQSPEEGRVLNKMSVSRLGGELLVRNQLISDNQLANAIAEQKKKVFA